MIVFSVSLHFSGDKLCSLLDLNVPSVRTGRANLLCIIAVLAAKLVHTSRFVRVILAQGHDNLLCFIAILAEEIVYTSRFERVMLAQGPC